MGLYTELGEYDQGAMAYFTDSAELPSHPDN